MIAIVDYEAGNIRSAALALAHFGAAHVVTADPATVRAADRIVIPGDGEARAAMESLRASGLAEAIVAAAGRGVAILGICIGAQIVLDRSDERDVACLGLIPGRAVKLERRGGIKVPHMGWNTIRTVTPHPIMNGIPDDAAVYFVHSYVPEPERAGDAVALCNYGRDFSAVIAHRNVVATQFHPEKSGLVGLRMVENFLEWQPGAP